MIILIYVKLYFADIVIDFNKEAFKNRKLLVYIITFLIKDNHLKKLARNKYYKNIFISCVERFFKYRYISDRDKILVRKRLSRLKFLKYQK